MRSNLQFSINMHIRGKTLTELETRIDHFRYVSFITLRTDTSHVRVTLIIYRAPGLPCAIGSITLNARVLCLKFVTGLYRTVNSCLVVECHNSACDKPGLSF